MTWVKLDDQFFVHRKIIGLSKDAKLFFLAATAYSSSSLLDGVLSPAVIRVVLAITDTGKACLEELKNAGLLEAHGNDLIIHDYLEYNPSASAVIAEREAAKERSRRNRQNKQGTESEYAQDVQADDLKNTEKARSNKSKSSDEVYANVQRTRAESSENAQGDVRDKFKPPVPGPESRNPDPRPEAINTAAADNLGRAREAMGSEALEAKLTAGDSDHPPLELADVQRLFSERGADGKSPIDAAKRQWRYWPFRDASSNPKAMFLKAIIEDWGPPPKWLEAKKQRDEREAQRRERELETKRREQDQADAAKSDAEFRKWWSTLGPSEQAKAIFEAKKALCKNPAIRNSVKRCEAKGIEIGECASLVGVYREALRNAVLAVAIGGGS